MKWNRAFLIFSAAILIFSGSYIFACHSSRFLVSEIKVSGNEKIPSEEIIKKAQECLDVNIFRLNAEKLEEKLREDIRLKDVKVRRRLPRCILLDVKEKTPVLWISLPAGLSHLENCGICGLSIDQEIIPLKQEDLSSDLPLVSGIEIKPRGRKPSQMPEPYRRWSNVKVEKALEFYELMTRIDPGSLEILAEVNLKDISNLTLYLLPGIKVMMGQDDFEKKWRRVRTILAVEAKIKNLTCLDLRFDDQVVLAGHSKRSSSERP
jgi:cell division septal protein FtsQ